MATPLRSSLSAPPVAWGFSSVILGVIATLLFFLPILSLPVSAAGIGLGLVGLLVFGLGGADSLRLCVAGLLLSSCAFGMVWAIRLAPTGVFSPRGIEFAVTPAADRLFIPPPAPPRGAERRMSSRTTGNSTRAGEVDQMR